MVRLYGQLHVLSGTGDHAIKLLYDNVMPEYLGFCFALSVVPVVQSAQSQVTPVGFLVAGVILASIVMRMET